MALFSCNSDWCASSRFSKAAFRCNAFGGRRPPNVPPVPLVLYCLLGFCGVLGSPGGSKCRHALNESCRNLGSGSVTTGPRVALLLVGVLRSREAMAPNPAMGWTLDTCDGLDSGHLEHSLPPWVCTLWSMRSSISRRIIANVHMHCLRRNADCLS